MKLLLENWRKYVLSEAARTAEDLPTEDAVVVIEERGDSFLVYYGRWKAPTLRARSKGEGMLGSIFKMDLGSVYVVDPETERSPYMSSTCGGAWMVALATAKSGWGPLLYDVAMEWATQKYNGLMADRATVSLEARNIWDYYLSQRGDVKAHQLDNSAIKWNKRLTPDDLEDDCIQVAITKPRKGHGPKPDPEEDWVNHPLSKRYTKSPSTINQLKSMDKLVIR
jgi:hypothetical protein